MATLVFDAENAIIGRLAAHAAKQALLGHKIEIVNCEKGIISGSKNNVVEKYKTQQNRGTPFRGPFLPRMPDRFVRRIIRGMISYNSGRGKEAFANIMCHIGVPSEFKDKVTVLERTHAKNRNLLKYTTIHEVCKALGAKI